MEHKNIFRFLPSVDKVLLMPEVDKILQRYPRNIVVDSVREALDELRDTLKNKLEVINKSEDVSYEEWLKQLAIDLVKRKTQKKGEANFRKVINGTGVVLHTNLGRAPLSQKAQEAINDIACNYSNLELDLSTGERGSRYEHITELLVKLTGAESALVVNNNAGAVLLALAALARNREVIVSRGQLVEIGGSFRVPEVMEQSGATLIEVGATNKTHPQDYERAITEETGLLLKVHTSNYRVVGFTRETSSEELVSIGGKYGVPVMEDLGSGFLVNLRDYGIGDEPTVQECVSSGMDIVTFSGDKLLGGPQAGIIIGKKVYVDKIKKHPLTRALRVDKLTLAALEATLREYLEPEMVLASVPTLKMLRIPFEELEQKAEYLFSEINTKMDTHFNEGERKYIKVEIIDGFSQVGGGALPTTNLKTKLVAICLENLSLNDIAAKLRSRRPAILVRINDNKILIDVRTILDNEIIIIASSLTEIISESFTK